MGLLDGKIAIITGAASPRGLGKATARLFAEHGATLAILDLDAGQAAAAAADHVFTLSTPMRDELVRRGVPAGRITLLPNSCDPTQFTPHPRDMGLAARIGLPADVPVIGYIGSFVQYEGLDDLARATGVDRFRLSRAFKAAFGLAPHAYLVQLRLAKARRLLAAGQPPALVAMSLGFADQSHMGRWFRRAYGLTPAHYRRRCSNLPDR